MAYAYAHLPVSLRTRGGGGNVRRVMLASAQPNRVAEQAGFVVLPETTSIGCSVIPDVRSCLKGEDTLISCVWPLALLAFQAPGDGWTLAQAAPREIRRIYWDLFQVTEVWLRLVPQDTNRSAPLVNLVFQAFFPGRPERDPYSGQPMEPKGSPARVVVRAQALPMTIIRDLSLRFVVDGTEVDLTAPGKRYRNLPCLVATDDCTPNAIQADLDAAVLSSLITARSVQGEALGFPINLSQADQIALAEFAARVGLRREAGPRR